MANEKLPVVLLIDDEKAIRESFRLFLEDHDYKVLEAENGRVGLELFMQSDPALVLVDLRMPEVDGLEVLANIRERSPDTPIIVVSGAGQIRDAIEALRLGAWDYLVKPIMDLSVLLYAIEKALERFRLVMENRAYQEHLEEEVARRTKELGQANKELQQINSRLRKIVESTKEISVFTRLDQFGSRLLEEFGKHMMASGGSMYLVEANGLRLIHALDPGHALDFIPYPLQKGSLLEGALTGAKPMLIFDVDKTSEFSRSGWGKYKDGSVLVFPIPDEAGDIVGLLSLHSKTMPPFVAQDKEIGSLLVSHSAEALRAARASEALAESEERLALAMDATNDGIWDWSIEEDSVYITPRCRELLGIKEDSIAEYTFDTWMSFVHSDDHDHVQSTLKSHFEGNTPFNVEYRHRYGNGGYRWLSSRGKALFNEKGKPCRMVGSSRDITERKRAEERLRTEHDKLQGVLNVIGEGLYIVNRHFDIEYQNKILENSFGSCKGKKCYKLYFSSDKPCTFCPATDTIMSGEIQHVEADLPDGRVFDITSSPFTDADLRVKAIVLLRDITEKKTFQAEAMRAGHLATIGELAAGVAHEINNPIGGVINYAEILKDNCEEKGEDADIPNRIIKEGERIAGIVRNLLSFARDWKEDFGPCDINNILSDTLSLIETRINKDGIKLHVETPGLPNIKARSQEIQQVFLNILSNSRHALNEKFPDSHIDKMLEIKGETLDLDGRRLVRIKFYDQGTGIPSSILDQICNPFFSTKPKDIGTGLGLSISHGIIMNHEGRLHFESVEDKYTKVIVDLPMWG